MQLPHAAPPQAATPPRQTSSVADEDGNIPPSGPAAEATTFTQGLDLAPEYVFADVEGQTLADVSAEELASSTLFTLNNQDPNYISQEERDAAAVREGARDTLGLPDSQEVQSSRTSGRLSQITALSDNEQNPVQIMNVVEDLMRPELVPETPEQVAARDQVRLLTAQREKLLQDPASYTQKGNLRAPAQRALLEFDDAIAAESQTLGTESTPTALPAVTSGNTTDLSKLSTGERRFYNRMLEKMDDAVELTDSENTTFDNLQAKVTGDPIEIITADETEKTQLLKELEDATQKEVERGKRELIQKKRINKLIRDYESGETGEVDETLSPENQVDSLISTIESFDPNDSQAAAGRGPSGPPHQRGPSSVRPSAPVRLMDEGTVVLLPNSNHIQNPRLKASLAKHDNGKNLTQGLHVVNKDGTSTTFFFLDRIPTQERLDRDVPARNPRPPRHPHAAQGRDEWHHKPTQEAPSRRNGTHRQAAQAQDDQGERGRVRRGSPR